MLFIKAEGNPVACLITEERQAEHVEKVGAFIRRMMTEGKDEGRSATGNGGRNYHRK